MTVRDAGWVRPEPLGSIGLGLGVRVTPVNGVFMEMRKFGVTVTFLPCGSQAVGGALR